MFNTLFSRSGLSFDRLRRFCEVAESGSISAAVEQYGRNQSSYSRDIAALEQFFEAQLFKQRGASRSGKRFDGLTPRGEELRQRALEFFETMELLLDYEGRPAQISIGAGEVVLQWVICARLSDIRTALPDVQIRLERMESDQILDRIEYGSLDIGVLESNALAHTKEDISAVELGEIEYALFLTEEMVEGSRNLSEKEMLSTLPLAGLEGLGPSATRIQEIARGDGYTLNFAVMLTSFPQITAAARYGQLAGFLPALAEKDMAEHGLIMLRHPFLDKLSVTISLVWNARRAELEPYLAAASSKLGAILSRTIPS